MSSPLRPLLARVVYGLLFGVLAPLALWVWARAAGPAVPLPMPFSPESGWVFVGGGAALVLAGLWGLWQHGGGLPMNAFPPPHLVERGVYRWVSDPIYLGFVLGCGGVAVVAGSASGLWLVTPCTFLALAALVHSYERPTLTKRFGSAPKAFIGLPSDTPGEPSWPERAGTAVAILLPWVICYEVMQALGYPPNALDARLPGVAARPVLVWSEVVSLSPFLVVPLAFLLEPDRLKLRRLAVGGAATTVVFVLMCLLVPTASSARPGPLEAWLGRLLQLEREGFRVMVLPSFRIVWAGLAASALAARGRGWSAAAWTWTMVLAVSTVAVGSCTLLAVIVGALCLVPLLWLGATWQLLRRVCERLANSWRCWRLGPVRFINHALWAGLAGAAGFWLASTLAGGWSVGVALVACCGLVGSALCAQLIEGSSALLRPFGYFGFLYGAIVGVLAASLLDCDVGLLGAAVAGAAPLAQAIGRVRCLVQGCCHGRAAPDWLGIRCHNPSSRVVALGGLGGVPIHPTQLYSILANLVTLALLLRLWSLGASLPLIAGLYLILSGTGRFAEEGFRGEPQTPSYGGLPIYQWLAICSVVAGAVLTALPPRSAPPPVADGRSLAAALVFGLLTALAMGVDFPASHRRFSRLSG